MKNPKQEYQVSNLGGTKRAKGKEPDNEIHSPACGNAEAYENLGGMPNEKTTKETHEDLKPSHVPEGVSPSRSRVI